MREDLKKIFLLEKGHTSGPLPSDSFMGRKSNGSPTVISLAKDIKDGTSESKENIRPRSRKYVQVIFDGL